MTLLMKLKYLVGVMVLSLVMAGCGGRTANVSDAEKKLSDTEKQLQEAKGQAGAEQRVAELEKQLADAKKELAAAKPEAAAPAAPAAPAEPPPPPKPINYVIAAGTPIPVRTTTALTTKVAKTGEPFSASLTQSLTVDGVVLAAAGAPVSGVIVLSDPGGKVKGKASISLALRSIKGTHGPIAVETDSKEAIAKSTVKKDVARGGIMTGAGAAIGAIAGGGKGAAIGAGVGAAAGVGTAMATKGAPAEFPAETALTFRTTAPVTVTVQP
jgi:hypothetical protein